MTGEDSIAFINNTFDSIQKNKIGFIFLDEIHHLYHFITVAIELAKRNEVSILTFPGRHEFLFNSLQRLGGSQVKVEQLPTLAFRSFTDKLKKRKLPRKHFWLQKNRNYLLNDFDALVFTDYFHHYLLKKRKEKAFPKFIKSPHGVAGRAYSFRKDLLDFDLNLLFGKFYFEQLKAENLLTENHAIIGYPKLDAVDPKAGFPAFKNDNPVVVYNPHFSPPFSSWHQMGLEVLEFFYEHENYNLIFAPHVNLFQKKGGQKADFIEEKFFKAENIFIDLGSVESVNMTYLQRADIYLGDVSSQVYEFLLQPRPCIFFNTEKVDRSNDPYFRFWKCGEVIEEAGQLEPALLNAFEDFKNREEVQKEITLANFYTEEGTTPSERAAIAIEEFLQDSRSERS